MKPKFEIGQIVYRTKEIKDKIIEIYEIREIKTKCLCTYLYEFNDLIPLIPEGKLILLNN